MKINFTFAAIFAGISKAAVSFELNKNNGIGSSTETRMEAAILDTVDDKKCWTQLGDNVIDTQKLNDTPYTNFAMARDALILAVRQNNVVKVYRLVENMWRAFGGNIDLQFVNNAFSQCRLSLSADGDVLAINHLKEDRVTIFKLNDEEWKPILVKKSKCVGGLQSISLSSNGTVVAIGSPSCDSAGHVRIFEYAAEEWKRRGDIITGDAFNDLSGYSVKLSADGLIVAIGAPNNAGNGVQSGHVRVFEFNADKNTWQQHGDDIVGEASGDTHGGSLSMSDDGTVLAVGPSITTRSHTGHTRVYKYSETATKWMQRGQDTDGESALDQASDSMDLSSDGSYVLVGRRKNEYDESVRVYGYDPTKSIWVQRGQDVYVGMNAIEAFTTAISGDATVVGFASGRSTKINVMKWMACPTPVPSSTPTVYPTIAPKPSSMATINPTSPMATINPTSPMATINPTSSMATINPTIAPIVLSLYLGYCFIFVF